MNREEAQTLEAYPWYNPETRAINIRVHYLKKPENEMRAIIIPLTEELFIQVAEGQGIPYYSPSLHDRESLRRFDPDDEGALGPQSRWDAVAWANHSDAVWDNEGRRRNEED